MWIKFQTKHYCKIVTACTSNRFEVVGSNSIAAHHLLFWFFTSKNKYITLQIENKEFYDHLLVKESSSLGQLKSLHRKLVYLQLLFRLVRWGAWSISDFVNHLIPGKILCQLLDSLKIQTKYPCLCNPIYSISAKTISGRPRLLRLGLP